MSSAWGSSWSSSWGSSWGSPATRQFVVPRPEGYTFDDWASAVTETFAVFNIASPQSENNWRDWVCSMFYEPELCAMNIPSPLEFERWQDWAKVFTDSVR